ncbi:hypothetical protein HHI36_007280 [Cryptolaemus montrouzieri]|uniref:Uncharacterized protein n=1 Tax=Cryptolaemus montrouzieri TaxID=559131 RepID=A0ABD2MP69_9CUCU
MSCCAKKTPDAPLPSCCKNKGDIPLDSSWAPNTKTSLIEDEEFPDVSLIEYSQDENPILESTRIEEIYNNSGKPANETFDISPIASDEDDESMKPSCCKSKAKSPIHNVNDSSITYSPIPPPIGSYGLSGSFAQSERSGIRGDKTYDVSFPRVNQDSYYSPIRQVGGTYGYSESYEQSVDPGGATYHATRDFTDVGPWKNVEIPTTLRKQDIPPGAHKSFPKTHVPKSSRNYSTYDPQEILNVREVTEHRRRAPRYYSTPQHQSFRGGEGLQDSTLWGQDISSFDPTRSSWGWSQGVRMDSFNVIKNITPSPKNIRVPPRLNQSYAATEATRVDPRFGNLTLPPERSVPSYVTRTDATYSRSPQVARLDSTFTRRPQPARLGATYTQQPQTGRLNATYTQQPQIGQLNATYTHQPQIGQLNATYTQRPQTARLNATYTQYPQAARLNTTYTRPLQTARLDETNTKPPQSGRLDSTFTKQRPRTDLTYTQRPQSANVTQVHGRQTPQLTELYTRPQPSQEDDYDATLPSCCQRPKTADPVLQHPDVSYPQDPGGDACATGTCGQIAKVEEIDTCYDDTCEQLNVTVNREPTDRQMNVYQPPNQPYDTILEIRAPHRSNGTRSNAPLYLSINIPSADHSPGMQSFCPGGPNSNKLSRCCQCP